MLFKEKKIESLALSPNYRIFGDKPFQYAFVYPSGWFEGGKVFEIAFPPIPKDLANAFGYIQPLKAQFTIRESTLTTVISFEEFTAEMVTDTVAYQINPGPEGEAFYIGDRLIFFTKKGTDFSKDLLRKNSCIYVSPGTYEKYDEISIEGSVALARDFLINFWVDKPGVTDGPAKESTKEEIRDYLKNRKTDILP